MDNALTSMMAMMAMAQVMLPVLLMRLLVLLSASIWLGAQVPSWCLRTWLENALFIDIYRRFSHENHFIFR